MMKTLPDKSIDLFLCDLPYGCLSAKRGGVRIGECPANDPNGNIVIVNKPCDWDIKIDLKQFWIQVKRLMKDDHTPIIHFCNARYGFELYNSNPNWFRYDLVWEKPNAVGFLFSNKQPLRSHENIYVFAKKGARYNRIDIEGDFPRAIGGANRNQQVYGMGTMPSTMADNTGRRCVKSVIKVANLHRRGNHPTQKPEDLYQWLIERYSKEGDTILDPTAGSFNSVFTAEKLGRKGIGIEKDEEFYNRAVSLVSE